VITTKSFQLTSCIFILFLLTLPAFGVVIDFRESLFFYLLPLLFSLNTIFEYKNIKYSPSPISLYFQGSLIVLFLISTILSLNPGSSYYYLWAFINVILILNLANSYIVSSDKFLGPTIIVSLLYSLVLILSKAEIISLPQNILGDNFILQVWGHSYLGNFLLIPIGICLHLILSKNKKIPVFYLIIFTISLVLSQSRSGLIGAIIVVLTLSTDSSTHHRLKKVFLAILIITLSLLMVFSGSHFAKYKSTDGSRPVFWRQAFIGISRSPIFGNGPATFSQINRQFKNPTDEITNTTHNSVLEYLTNNGLIFTLLLLAYIDIGLIHQKKQNPLFYSIGLGLFISSLLDSFLASPGFLVLLLIFSTYHHPLFYKPENHSYFRASLPIFFTSTLLLFFFISKTSSDIFYFLGRYEPSVKLDPFNLNSLIQQNTKQSLSVALKLYKNDDSVLIYAINKYPLPESLPFFQRLLTVYPQTNPVFYNQLGQYYLQTGKFQDLTTLLSQYDYQFNNTSHFTTNTSIAKLYYSLALYQWQNNSKELAIKSSQKSILYSGGWSQFHIELANMYYHTGQEDLAQLQLTTNCAKYPPSITMCTEYRTNFPNSLPTPGSAEIKKSIEDIP
jgi:hypothetical protein